MGRNENSSGGAIAVIVIAIALVIMLVLGLAVVGAGFFFVAQSDPRLPMAAPASATSSAAVPAAITIAADDDGIVLVDGQAYSDEEFRVILRQHLESNEPIHFALGENISEERRAEIQAIYDEVVNQSRGVDPTRRGESETAP